MLRYAVLLLAVLRSVSSQGFCGLENCNGAEHVDCTMASGKFGAACPSNAVMLNLEPVQKQILQKFNTYRNKVAGGKQPNFFAATRMATLQWNITLANLGRRNTKKCDFTQDACSNTPDWDYVGQSIARAVFPLTDKRTNIEIILQLIDVWFKENTDTNSQQIRILPPPTDDGPVIANFCQIVRDYATRVGCAALTYKDSSNKVLLFTCNFNLANVIGWPVYDDGAAASRCKKTNLNYPNLCSVNEVYNVNTFYEDY